MTMLMHDGTPDYISYFFPILSSFCRAVVYAAVCVPVVILVKLVTLLLVYARECK